MKIILHTFLLIVCSIIAAVWVDAAPYYSLSGTYYFNGQSSNSVQLTDLVCVKGNNARTIQFQMQTSVTQPNEYGFGAMIGMK